MPGISSSSLAYPRIREGQRNRSPATFSHYVTKGTGRFSRNRQLAHWRVVRRLGGALSSSRCWVAVIGSSRIRAVGIFFVNSVLASYNITGTIEGFHDPKFKRWPRAFVACLIASIVLGIWAALIVGFQAGVF
jgi:tetrahydromethanopterin S-methyltransferase subunit D